MRGVRRWATVAAAVAVLLAAAVLALALSASPASAYTAWQHETASTCGACHSQGTPTDAVCITCHGGLQSFPGMTCWSCHAPGQDTSTLSAPSSACSQECHLWNSVQKQYITPTSHGTNPHLGATPACLDCHSMSASSTTPGSNPHHSGQETGFTDCGACHSQPQKHAGKVACASCHKNATAFHLFQAASPGFKKCGSCHAMKHARVKVPVSKCASCHKGSSGRPAQHSSKITKKYVCGTCHSKPLHAHAVSNAVKSCRTCHSGKYHAWQKTPSRTVCTRCHGSALSHANGFQCILCHKSAVHNSRPSARF